jgi:hypothetical protein
MQRGVRRKVTPAPEQVHKAELTQGQVLLRQIHQELLTAVLQAVVPGRVIHSQNLLQVTTRFTGRVQHITEVRAPDLHQDLTAHLLQVQEVTKAARRCEAAAVVTVAAVAEVTAVAAAVEAVEVHTPEAPAVVHQEAVADALREVVHLLPVADNYRKYMN